MVQVENALTEKDNQSEALAFIDRLAIAILGESLPQNQLMAIYRPYPFFWQELSKASLRFNDLFQHILSALGARIFQQKDIVNAFLIVPRAAWYSYASQIDLENSTPEAQSIDLVGLMVMEYRDQLNHYQKYGWVEDLAHKDRFLEAIVRRYPSTLIPSRYDLAALPINMYLDHKAGLSPSPSRQNKIRAIDFGCSVNYGLMRTFLSDERSVHLMGPDDKQDEQARQFMKWRLNSAQHGQYAELDLVGIDTQFTRDEINDGRAVRWATSSGYEVFRRSVQSDLADMARLAVTRQFQAARTYYQADIRSWKSVGKVEGAGEFNIGTLMTTLLYTGNQLERQRAFQNCLSMMQKNSLLIVWDAHSVFGPKGGSDLVGELFTDGGTRLWAFIKSLSGIYGITLGEGVAIPNVGTPDSGKGFKLYPNALANFAEAYRLSQLRLYNNPVLPEYGSLEELNRDSSGIVRLQKLY